MKDSLHYLEQLLQLCYLYFEVLYTHKNKFSTKIKNLILVLYGIFSNDNFLCELNMFLKLNLLFRILYGVRSE